MSMSELHPTHQQLKELNEPLLLPCTATCINLQALPKAERLRLGLSYRTGYTIVSIVTNPTPQHLGKWVKLARAGREQFPDEWLSADFFIINTVVWPN